MLINELFQNSELESLFGLNSELTEFSDIQNSFMNLMHKNGLKDHKSLNLQEFLLLSEKSSGITKVQISKSPKTNKQPLENTKTNEDYPCCLVNRKYFILLEKLFSELDTENSSYIDKQEFIEAILNDENFASILDA